MGPLMIPHSTGAEPHIEVELSENDGNLQNISRVDFVSQLPLELAIHVLACLDAATLCRSCSVSRNWNIICQNQHVWRESCLQNMTTTYATSGPIEFNTGHGVPKNAPTSDWRQIYRAKHELDQRWRAGKVQPIYLKGHKDSIYCVQFDE